MEEFCCSPPPAPVPARAPAHHAGAVLPPSPLSPRQRLASDPLLLLLGPDVGDSFAQTCIVIDLFSRRVLSHKIGEEITSNLVWDTFEEAFERRKRPAGLTFHSDQGAQYTDFHFRKRLRQLGVNQSFSKPGTPLDNAVAESFFSCMKREELSHKYYDTIEALEQAVSEYIKFYNSVRIHERLGYLTPNQVEEEFFSR